MAGDVGELHGKRRLEIPVEELVVASAHARRGDLQENLVRLGLGHGNLFDPKRFLVSVHSGGSHLHVIPSSSSDKKWPRSLGNSSFLRPRAPNSRVPSR